jgi:hypothetical protein
MTNNILMPKIRSNFVVDIREIGGPTAAKAEDLEAITRQLIAVDIGAELLLPPTETGMLKHKSDRLVLWLEDDIACLMMKAVRTWQQNQRALTIVVYTVNNEREVIDTFIFNDAWFEALQHSMLTYESAQDRISLTAEQAQTAGETARMPAFELNGTVQSCSTRSTAMKLLQVSFKEYCHIIAEEPVKVDRLL